MMHPPGRARPGFSRIGRPAEWNASMMALPAASGEQNSREYLTVTPGWGALPAGKGLNARTFHPACLNIPAISLAYVLAAESPYVYSNSTVCVRPFSDFECEVSSFRSVSRWLGSSGCSGTRFRTPVNPAGRPRVLRCRGCSACTQPRARACRISPLEESTKSRSFAKGYFR